MPIVGMGDNKGSVVTMYWTQILTVIIAFVSILHFPSAFPCIVSLVLTTGREQRCYSLCSTWRGDSQAAEPILDPRPFLPTTSCHRLGHVAQWWGHIGLASKGCVVHSRCILGSLTFYKRSVSHGPRDGSPHHLLNIKENLESPQN